MKINIVSLFFCALFISCARPQSNNHINGIPTISISCEKNQVLNISEFADSIEIIPLETNNDCLIGWIHRIISTDDRYYLSSAVSYDTEKLYVFDKKGKFISQIGKEGEGSEEYLGMNDFTLINDSIIKISENFNLTAYDNDGKFLFKKKQRDCPLEIYSFKGKVYGINVNKQIYDNKMFFQLNENGDNRKDFFSLSPIEAKVCDYYVRTAMLTADTSFIYFNYPFCNTIYKLDTETLESSPFYQVDFVGKNVSKSIFEKGNHYRDWDAAFERYGSYWGIDEILDLNNYLIINAVDETYHSCFSIYSKKTKKVLSGQCIRDDIYFKGNQTKLRPRYTPHYRDGDYLLWVIKPEFILKGYHAYRKALGETKWELFCKKYPRLVEVCEQLDEESNPVLLKIRLKDF